MIGQTISHYRVLEKIGEGGMGLVYLAEDSTLRRKVALKFLPDYLQEDETAHKRFIREARSAAALDHPFICHIHEVGEVEGRDFIAMEYVEGKTLRETLKEGPLSLNDALRIANELIDALEKAHSQRIVHRDLKPSNIMLTPDGHIKVMDFGLAKRISAAGTPEQDITVQPPTQALTQTGTTLGTVTYMSPEQACGESVDTRSDIFSFGIVLYEMLTGKNPFHEGSPVRTLSAILNKPAPLLSQERKGFPAGLEELVVKMLEKKPERRCQSVAEVRDELGKLDTFSLWDLFRKLIPASPIWRWLLAAVGVLIVAGLAQQLGLFQFARAPGDTAVKGDVSKLSLAVLPFRDHRGDPDRDYWAPDMTDELISQLWKLGKWKRLPDYQSIKGYEGSELPVPEIGKALDVDLLVSGSFFLSEGVQLDVKLWEAAHEELLWSESYYQSNFDRRIKIVVARDIADRLGVSLARSQLDELERGTTNREAYEAYMRGRSKLLIRTGPALKESFQEFSRAIELDPGYALAYSGLAYSQAVYAGWGFETPANFWPDAMDNAEFAIGKDPSIAEAHSALGLANMHFKYDWLQAEDEFSTAMDINPNDPMPYHYNAILQVSLGRSEKGFELEQKSLELRPESASHGRGVAFLHFLAGEHEEAVRLLNQLLTRKPNFLGANYWLFLCYHKLGEYEKAWEALLRSYKTRTILREGVGKRILKELPPVYEESGYQTALNHLGDMLAEESKKGYVHATLILYAYAAAENRDAALEWLKKTHVDQDASVAYLQVHPMWEFLRDDPIYQDLLAQLNFPEN